MPTLRQKHDGRFFVDYTANNRRVRVAVQRRVDGRLEPIRDPDQARAWYQRWLTVEWPVILEEPKSPREDAQPAAGARIRDIVDWYVDRHLPHLRRAPRTIAKYDQVLRDFETFCRARHVGRTQQLTWSRIEEFLDWSDSYRTPRTGPAKAAKTRRDYLAIIRSCLRAAADADLIPAVPIRKWFMPPADPQDLHRDVQTSEQQAAMLEIIQRDDPHIYPPVLFLVGSGIRVSDCIDLRWSQVHLDRQVIRRPQIKTKHLASYPINAIIRQALDLARPQGRIPRDGYVFLDPCGRPWTYNILYRRFTRTLDRAGFRPMPSFKTIRTTFGTLQAHAGCPPVLLQRMMGHRDIQTTLLYYQHFDDAQALDWSTRYANELLKTQAPPGTTPQKSP